MKTLKIFIPIFLTILALWILSAVGKGYVGISKSVEHWGIGFRAGYISLSRGSRDILQSEKVKLDYHFERFTRDHEVIADDPFGSLNPPPTLSDAIRGSFGFNSYRGEVYNQSFQAPFWLLLLITLTACLIVEIRNRRTSRVTQALTALS